MHACMHARADSLEALTDELLQRRKVPMKEIFGIPKLKRDGTPGACVLLQLHHQPSPRTTPLHSHICLPPHHTPPLTPLAV